MESFNSCLSNLNKEFSSLVAKNSEFNEDSK